MIVDHTPNMFPQKSNVSVSSFMNTKPSTIFRLSYLVPIDPMASISTPNEFSDTSINAINSA